MPTSSQLMASRNRQSWRLGEAVALFVFFGIFLLYPLFFVFRNSLIVDGTLSLEFFTIMATSPNIRESLLNSLNVAALVTLLVTLIAYPLAMIMTRVSVPNRSLVHAVLLLPLVLPPFVGALGIRQILSRFGTINILLLDLGLVSQPVDFLAPGHPWGLVVTQAIHFLPISYLYLRASLSGVPGVLEESARLCGAGNLRVFFSILVPLTMPAAISAAVLIFVGSLTDVGTPLLFEFRRSLPVEIYNMLTDLHENRVGYALVSSVVVLCLLIFGVTHAQAAQFSIEQSARTERIRKVSEQSRGLKVAAWVFLAAVASIGILPHVFLILTAFADRWMLTALPASYTFENFLEVFHHPLTFRSILNSLLLSSVSTVVIILVGFGVAYLRWRTSTPGKAALEFLSLTPLAIPGLVFAFGYLAAFSNTFLDARRNPFPLLIAAYVVRRLPPMVKASITGLQESSRTLEEAALTLGARPSVVTRTITLPLVARHLAAGAILAFAFSMLEVSDSLLLAVEEKFFPISKAMYAMVSRPDGTGIAAALGVLVSIILAGAFWISAHLSRNQAGGV